MKIQPLLESASPYTELNTTPHLKQFIEANCSDAIAAYKKGRKLFRGMSEKNADVVMFRPGIRHGAQHLGTNFHYNLINTMPEWKDIPDRTQSLDMSTDLLKAGQYGSGVRIAFPVNNAIMAYGMAARDFWDIFEEPLNMWYGWLSRAVRIAYREKIQSKGLDTSTNIASRASTKFLSQMWQLASPTATNRFIEKLEKLIGKEETDQFIEFIKKGAKEVITTTDITTISNDVEVWCSDKIFLLTPEIADEWWGD